MDNGTNIDDMKRDLDAAFEALYAGLNKVANKVRNGGSPDAIADEIAELAWEFCRRWPICRAEHNLAPPPENPYQKTV